MVYVYVASAFVLIALGSFLYSRYARKAEAAAKRSIDSAYGDYLIFADSVAVDEKLLEECTKQLEKDLRERL